jgi:stress-induced morphogen
MALKDRVEAALRNRFQVDHIQLDDEDGIYGWVVSPVFRRLSSLDRQTLIDEALRDPSMKLTKREERQIMFIEALTPVEYREKASSDR